MYLSCLRKYGKTWNKFEEKIPNKTLAQIRNFFQNYKSKMNLVAMLEEHEAKMRRKKEKKKKRKNKRKRLVEEGEGEEDDEEAMEIEEEEGRGSSSSSSSSRPQKRSRLDELKSQAMTKKGGASGKGTPRAGVPLEQVRSLWKRD